MFCSQRTTPAPLSFLPCTLPLSLDTGHRFTLKRIRLLLCALLLGQLLAPLLNLLVPVDDVFLEGRGENPVSSTDDQGAPKGSEFPREYPQGSLWLGNKLDEAKVLPSLSCYSKERERSNWS